LRARVTCLNARGASPAIARQALVEGFGAAAAWAAGIVVVGALIVAVLMNTPRSRPQPVATTAEPQHAPPVKGAF
jgi:hypothetical protein